MTRIYLDHAATSPLRPEAKAAMEEGVRIWANPSSPHAEGRKAKAALEDARLRIKRALGLGQGDKNYEVIFTSGASEALWIALNRSKATRRIVSAVEHDAVFRAAPDAEILGLGDGALIGRENLENTLSKGGEAIVAIQHVNSETGVVQPIWDYHSAVREAGGNLLVDCSQSAAKLECPDADMIIVSAHKFGGPIGIGALLVRNFKLLQPTGGHERGYRQGTENVPAALGMAAALEQWPGEGAADFYEIGDRFGELADLVRESGGQIVDGEGMTSMFIKSIAHPTLSAQALLIRLDAMGFAVSAGSACSSGTLKKSRVLDAFGVPDDVAARTIRVSIGWSTTPEELDKFTEAWRSLA